MHANGLYNETHRCTFNYRILFYCAIFQIHKEIDDSYTWLTLISVAVAYREENGTINENNLMFGVTDLD